MTKVIFERDITTPIKHYEKDILHNIQDAEYAMLGKYCDVKQMKAVGLDGSDIELKKAAALVDKKAGVVRAYKITFKKPAVEVEIK